MGAVIDYKKEFITLTKELPKNRLNELLDFAQFLKAKTNGFSYTDITDAADHVRKLRKEEGKRVKSSKEFIEEVKEWQKSNS